MNCILFYSIFITILLTLTVTARNEPYDEQIVAANPKSLDQTKKQGQPVIGRIVAVDSNLHSRINKQENLRVDGIVPAKYYPENRMNQTKIRFVTKNKQ